jgi:O-antigen ligase
MPSKRHLSYFLLAYAALRVFSFFFQPGNIVNLIFSAIIILAVAYFLIRKDERGWYIVAAEIILGGSGNLSDIKGISLRTLLLLTSMLIYFIIILAGKRLREFIRTNKKFVYAASALMIWVLFAGINGYVSGHDFRTIITETIPYLFLFYYFPLKDLLQKEEFKRTMLTMLCAAVFGNLIFILFTFAGYSSGILKMFDSYYHWFRDVANGKITEYPFHYYRLVLNEQLLAVPLLIFFVYKLIKKFSWFILVVITALLVILSINITRVYILALPLGLIFLFTRQNWKRWLAYSLACLLIFIVSFTAVHLSASRGQSLGWEFFGLRLQSIAAPAIEDSSLSRLLLLPKITEKIQRHPLFGGGLGDEVTVYSPIFQANITTKNFDWGYLEMADELGILGTILYVFIVYILIQDLFKRKKIGLLAPLAALMVINITSPALFHVMGIIWIAALAANQTVLAQND